jgi:outer membrane protein OmpA-like peptidoglycan-associated protein
VRRIALALVLMTATPALAGKGEVDIEHLLPNASGRGIFNTESADTHGKWQWGLGLVLHYAKDPFHVAVNGVETPIVDQRLTGTLLFSLGLTSWLELGAALPVSLYNSHNADLTGFAGSAGLGSFRLQLKLRVLREIEHGLGLAILPAVFRLPTGDTDGFLGQDGIVYSVAGALERSAGPVRFLVNFGYTARSQTRYRDQAFESEIFWRFGIGWRAHGKVELGLEYVGLEQNNFFSRGRGHPMELLFGGRLLPSDRWQVWLGGGPGFTDSYGAPDFRLFAGVVYAPHEVDTDGDGVPDRIDACPKDAGPRDNRGCLYQRVPIVDADGDKDGLADKDDACPKVAGPRENRGCPWPDRDGDGLPDKDDRCPDQAGPRENQGCPPAAAAPARDTDGDGLPDDRDACPLRRGPLENRGCPWPDRDDDGLPDKDDRCPDRAGPRENQGCPLEDRDHDGVPDRDDECPTQPGPASNKGCPVAKVVITRTEVRILEQVSFRTGSATILRGSFGILDSVARVLSENPDLALVEVQGHTDDRGRKATNLRLSLRRANAVRGYLVRKGVAANRLVAKGYGDTQPLVPIARGMPRREIDEARAKNRRVQFVILRREAAP